MAKVSVVVPTYNSGTHIEPLIDSMLGQTMPREAFEVIFVDDGSTDDTPARLEALAAEYEHFRVIRIPNSGWPGKPRNTGVAQARGEYVQFVDHDDRMAPEALERLYAMGVRNGSDIVIGKVASNFTARSVPHGLMSRTRESCTVWNAPLIDSVTAHKTFRTAFLRENGIVFPEGPWIMEDLIFMTRAYLKASVVSILADYVCYSYWARGDQRNTSSAPIAPSLFYGHLREILETIVAGTEPGEQRDRLVRRFYRTEMLHRLGEPPRGVLIDPPFDSEPFDLVRELAGEFVTDGVHDGLAPAYRIRSTLLRQNKPDAITEFTRRQYDLRARTSVEAVTFGRERFRAAFTARFEEEPGGPGLMLSRRGDRYRLAPALTEGLLDEPLDVTDELKSFRAELLLRHTRTAHTWILPQHDAALALEEEDAAEADGTVRVRPVVRGTVAIDPQRAAGGGPLDEGVWEVQIRVMGAGLDRYAPLGAGTEDGTVDVPPAALLGGREARVGLAEGGLTVTVRETAAVPGPRAPKVSVVVPVDGAAPQALQETLGSLAAQSLPAGEFEVILVGQTEQTEQAATAGPGHRIVRPQPGGDDPRNAGIDAATGEYVLFMQAGDRLAEQALERMYAYGLEHDADVVAGKLAGRNRAVPRELFVRDRPKASLAKDPLPDSLTADKLFYREFLAEHGIRFTRSGEALADHAFTAQAYLRAPGRVAVLGGYVCYHYGSAPGPAPAPGDFYAGLRSVLETVDRIAEPGEARDRLHRRWLRVEMLDRLSAGRLAELDDTARRELFYEVRKVLTSHVSPSAVAGLPAPRRVAAGLIADDRLEDLVALAEWERSVACRPRLDEVTWQQEGAGERQEAGLRIAFTAALHSGDGPVGVAADRDTLVPSALSAALRERFAAEPLTGAAAPDRARAVLVLRDRASGAEYTLPTTSTVTRLAQDGLQITGTSLLNPATVIGGAPLGDGAWDLYVRLTALGWAKTGRLGSHRAASVPDTVPAVPHPTAAGRLITPYWTNPHRDLSLRVAAPTPAKPTPGKPGLLRRAARKLGLR
jgi:glycosyltransferase involved in cell wall biosynthesis